MADQSMPVTGNPAHSAKVHPCVASPPHAPQNQATYFHVAENPYYTDPYACAIDVQRFFTALVGFILIAGMMIFTMWLLVHPQTPQFRVETLTLSKFNISSYSLIFANWDARFTVWNPNNFTLYYDRIKAAVFYKSDLVSKTTVPPFVQGTENETSIRATSASLSAYLDDWDSINSDTSHGTVNFNVRMMARVRFKTSSWWRRRRSLWVYCPNLSIGVSSNNNGGSLVGGSKQCSVSIFG